MRGPWTSSLTGDFPYFCLLLAGTGWGVQIEEMYSVPESFLEIEVRNPQTHGAWPVFPSIFRSFAAGRVEQGWAGN